MQPVIQRFEHQAMSTLFELLIVSDERELARSAAHKVFSKVDQMELLLSRFIEASEVSLIANLKPGVTFSVSPELMELLLLSTRVCAATRGAFDITVGALMDALRGVKHRWVAITPTERDDLLATCGMNRLILDPDSLLIAVKPDRLERSTAVELDFGAIGKGYALDLAAAMLREEWDFNDFLIHGGTSTVIAYGSSGDGQVGWPIKVGGDWRERAGLSEVRLAGGAISGSGSEVKGEHVVDARRGIAAKRHAAAWAYAESAALSDALSTALLGLDFSEIVTACQELGGCGALVAREQPRWLDRLRRPVRHCGIFPGLAQASNKRG